MGYSLGVDLGTAYTAAAVCQNGQVEVVRLGDRSDFVPSVVYRGLDGGFLFGELAERHAVSEPERISREFKRRMGDTKRPIVIGGTPMPAHALSRAFLIWVLELVESALGGPPEHVTVSFPANWGPYRRELMQQVTALPRDVPVTFCTEPEAVAVHFASTGRLTGDGPLAVYDLGAGTFDTCLVRRTEDGLFELFGTPEGIEQCGGDDFDYAILQWVLRTSGVDDIDEDDEGDWTSLARLRRECVEAKEALSSETEVTITGSAGGQPIKVRLTRTEFEELIRPRLAETVDCLEHAIRKAGQRPTDLSGVVLAGGSARVPLVSELVTERLARPVTVSTRPKLCVAMGAALMGATQLTSAAVAPPEALEVRTRPAGGRIARRATPAAPAVADEAVPPRRGSVQLSLVGATAVPTEQPSGSGLAAALLKDLPWYRYATLALSLLAIILALVPSTRAPGDVYRWNEDFVVSAPKLADDVKIQPTLLGIKPPGPDPARVTGQQFNLKPYSVWLGGPVAAKIGAEGVPAELHPQEFTGSRFVTIGFVGMVLSAMFSFAYVTSMLRMLRRRRRSASPAELLGLGWAGGFVGVAVVLAAWVLAGNRLDAAIALIVMMMMAVAVAMLGLGPTWRGHR